MQGQTPATSEEGERLQLISELWCLPCSLDEWDGEPCTVQHVVEGKVRLGHLFTYGSCPWHHQGHPPFGMNIETATACRGPSLSHNKPAFEQYFGAERKLVMVEDRILIHAEEARRVWRVFRPKDFGMIARREAENILGRPPSRF